MKIPALNLKAKLIGLMVLLLGLTLGTELIASLQTQQAVVEATQRKVKDLASAIQISVQELSSVGATNRDRLQNFIQSLPSHGLEVSIASSQELIINSSNPKLIGSALKPDNQESVVMHELARGKDLMKIPPMVIGPLPNETTVYLIPVKVEDHLLGYVQVIANFADFARPLQQSRVRLLTAALAIFAIGLVLAYILAERYVQPIHGVAAAAQNIASRGLEPVPDTARGDEIGLLTRSFNQMVDQLRRARERELELARLERFTALGQLAGGLAHEIKNPLNFISLAADRLRARYAPQLTMEREEFVRQVGIMKDEVRRLNELIQSFLNYGKPIEIRRTPTDIHALVHSVLALSDSKVKSQGIEVAEEGSDVPAMLSVDAEKLRICFLNVVANAIQAMPDGGRLTIKFERVDGKLVTSFTDTGSGIDPEVSSHVFEPFFTTKREGIGLGLFLSKAIVEKHDGMITIGPNDGVGGTRVTFTLPLSAPQAEL